MLRIDPFTLGKLREYLGDPTQSVWGHNIEIFAPDYGTLLPTDIPSLSDDKLSKLWVAGWFAIVRYEFPKPDASQWKGLRKVTAVLADRAVASGDRFCEARKMCKMYFRPREVQSPVVLRTLLILEGGLFGSIATMNHTNLLLKETDKPELNYGDANSITLALKHIKKVIEKWAPKVGATTLGERARIPWHLCQIIDPEVGKKGRKPKTGNAAHSAMDMDTTSLGADIKKITSNKTIDSTTAEVLINARLGQGRFGQDVRKIWNYRCSVTGSSTKAALEASHIKRWADSTDEERLDAKNGLLLTANLHKLFDAGLISFDDTGKMLVSSELSQAEKSILGVVGDGLSQEPSAKMAEYLSHHRARFLK